METMGLTDSPYGTEHQRAAPAVILEQAGLGIDNPRGQADEGGDLAQQNLLEASRVLSQGT